MSHTWCGRPAAKALVQYRRGSSRNSAVVDHMSGMEGCTGVLGLGFRACQGLGLARG